MVYRRRERTGWWFHVDDPATGRQRQVKSSKARRADAEAEAAAYKAELKRRFRPKGPDDFWQFIHHDYWPSQLNHLTLRAMQRELGILEKHLGPFFDGSMSNINRNKLIDYISIRAKQEASRESIRKELGILKHAL